MRALRHDGGPSPLRIRSYTSIIGLLLILLSPNDLMADVRVDYEPIRAPNLCLPDAVGFQMALQVQYPGTWSRILRLDWNVKQNGRKLAHAYCIYEFNKRLYAYDSRGGQRQLSMETSAKYQPQVLGRYLGGNLYGTAAYLPAFDPVRVATASRKSTPAGLANVASQ